MFAPVAGLLLTRKEIEGAIAHYRDLLSNQLNQLELAQQGYEYAISAYHELGDNEFSWSEYADVQARIVTSARSRVQATQALLDRHQQALEGL